MLSLVLGVGLLTAAIPSRTPTVREQGAQRTQIAKALTAGAVTLQATADSDELAGQAESATFHSAALGRDLPYMVYRPPRYDAEPNARYPVLYLLHGLGGSYTEWYGYGVFDAADRLITSGEIPPLIIVLPEGERGYWVDHANGGPQWGTYVARDLVSEIDARYSTTSDGAHRAIGGMSMGGYGALELAMLYPGEFGIVGANAPTLHRSDDMVDILGDQAYFAAHDPASLIANDPTDARALTLSLEVGQDDVWLPVVTELHQELLNLGVPHQWRIYAGGHTSESWAAQLDSDLRFYGAALEGPAHLAEASPP